MSGQRRTLLGAAAAAALASLSWPARADDAVEARNLVDRARMAFGDVVKVKEYDSLRAGLKGARGVLIYPEVLRGGLFLGGSGGTGVLLVRGEGNDWSEPAFYTMGSVSFGLQFGGSSAQIVVLINSRSAVDRLMSSTIKLGGDASAAAGPVGVGKSANLTADFVSYARARGAFIGVSVEGALLDVRASLNSAYYGRPVTPIDIVVKRAVSNPHSAALRSAVAAASR